MSRPTRRPEARAARILRDADVRSRLAERAHARTQTPEGGPHATGPTPSHGAADPATRPPA